MKNDSRISGMIEYSQVVLFIYLYIFKKIYSNFLK